MMQLIIDPGHGGKDPGAVAFGEREKDWALKVSVYQYERFKALGIQVDMTRFDDSTLFPAARISRVKNKATFCISNHFNAFNGSVRGIEVIHSIHSSDHFAKEIAQNLVEKTDLPLRRVFSRTLPNKKQDYYFMHRMTGHTQTLIIEYGFIDHPLDHQHYKQANQIERAAEAVIEAVCKELKVEYKPKQPWTKGAALTGAAVQPVKRDANLETDKKTNAYSGKMLQSIHDGQLRFYKKPSWKDEDVFGYMKKGQIFPIVKKKIKVEKGEQYQVANRKGEVYYVTAHPKYVTIK